MSLKDLSTFVSGKLNAAGSTGQWSEWMVERSGYLVRDLTPVVRSLQADGIPFLLTRRAAVFKTSGGPEEVFTYDPDVVNDRIKATLKFFQKGLRWNPKPATTRRIKHIEVFEDDAPPETLFSLFVEVPQGLVWEIVSKAPRRDVNHGRRLTNRQLTRWCDAKRHTA